LPKVHYLKGALAGGVLAALGGFLAPAALAAPSPLTPPDALAATLSHSGTGSAAVWAGPDAVKLTPGSTGGTYAQLTVTNPPSQAPVTEPSFTTDNYNAGSPRWVITFSNSCYIFVYPTGSGQFAPVAQNAEVEPGTGGCSTSPEYVSWATAVQAAEVGGATVTGVQIVADGDQTAGTTDTVSDILYNGQEVTGGFGRTSPPSGPGRGQGPGQGQGQGQGPGRGPGRGPGGTQQRPGTGEISSFTDHGASCLTASGDTNESSLVLDRCGTQRGTQQDFTFGSAHGRSVLEAITRNNRGAGGHKSLLCVTAPLGEGPLTLQRCTGSAGQEIAKRGPYYVFEGDRGYVMDDPAWSTVPGTPVIAYPQNSGRNQRWSAPGA
jgi:hypothetical protein